MAAQRKKSNLKETKRLKTQAHVLSSLANGLSVTEVCCNADIARETYYNWIRDDPDFARHVECTRDVRASFIDSVLWHAACRAIGDPKYHRAAIAYLQINEQREKRKDQQRRWEAEQKRWEAEHERWQAEHARWQAEHERWQAEQKQKKEANPQAPEKPKRPRAIRLRHSPPLPPKYVRQLVTQLTTAIHAASLTTATHAAPLTDSAPPPLAQISGDGASVPPPLLPTS